MEMISKTTNLCKCFSGQTVVNNISLNIERNSIYGLLGPNGAGKSTTLKMITGILKPTSGSIEFDGHTWKRSDLNHIGIIAGGVLGYEGNLLGLSLFWGIFESLQCILYSKVYSFFMVYELGVGHF